MATALPSLTAAHRRKRLATYGKSSSRVPAAFNIHDDVPSPERPRKHVGRVQNAPVKRPTATVAPSGSVTTARLSRPKLPTAPPSHDVFDVPSDTDELAPRPSPPLSKPSPPKSTIRQDDFDVPSSDDEPLVPSRRVTKPPQKLSRPAVVRKQSVRLKETSDVTSSDDPLATGGSVAKSPLGSRKTDTSSRQVGSTTTRPLVKPKLASRATTPAPNTSTHKWNNSAHALSLKPINKLKAAPEPDIFDVPSSGEEDVSKRTPRRARPAPISRAKTPTGSRAPSTQPSPCQPVESDDSAAVRKRKRQAAGQVSLESVVKDTAGLKTESLPQRSSKYRKKEGSVSPGNGVVFEFARTAHKSVTEPIIMEPPINKPRRTKTRTVPLPLRHPISKGLSSPATLNAIVAGQEAKLPNPSSAAPPLPSQDLEDETMYDVQESTTPARGYTNTMRSPIDGSVTPRQKQIFGSLLGDSSKMTTPGILKFGSLQLSERKTVAGQRSLARSKSEITTSARKPKLIDTLIRAAPALDEEDETSSETEESSENEATESTPVVQKSYGRSQAISVVEDKMDIDADAMPSSQASQSSLHMNGGPRRTYAKQRSYLEEANFEDELLLSIPMDTDIPTRAFGQRKAKPQPVLSDDEDDTTKKVRGIHELRKQGQDFAFKFETQALLDDIADRNKSAKSKRRISMLELCKHMMDKTFIGQLFDAAFDQQLFRNWSSAGEIIFDFAVAFAVALIAKTHPGFNVLDQIFRSSAITTLTSLLEFDADIDRIAKQRSTNMSGVGRESVSALRNMVLDALWPAEKPAKVSPRILAMKTLDLLVLGLRKAGSPESLLDEDAIVKLLDIAAPPCDRLQSGTATAADHEIMGLSFSIMEAVSCSKELQATWSNKLLRRIVDMIPVFFKTESASPIKLAIRLSMNLTNNKPKTCDAFAGPGFVQPLVRAINQRFLMLSGTLPEEERMDVLEALILSLGAMINLAEFSDAARASVCTDDEELINALVKTFLDGLERAAQANSMEESQSSVAIGYLTVLLGNLCLNDTVRARIRARLPNQKIDVLVNAVVEFIHYNEKVDRELRDQFDGDEGRETWANFTKRLRGVVERVREAEGHM